MRRAVEALGWTLHRGHPFDIRAGHGFIDSQRRGIEVFRDIPPDAPLVVAEAVWQYSHHVLPGLRTHRGPILIVANWNGTYPGLVGLLGLSASLTKAGVNHSTLWSADFTDAWALGCLQTWLDTGKLVFPADHVRPLPALDADVEEVALGRALATQLQREKAIIGVFDEGCMGMYNAIVNDELMHSVLHGVERDQLMAKHRASHVHVAYAPSRHDADRAATAKAALFHHLGISVHLCGDIALTGVSQ